MDRLCAILGGAGLLGALVAPSALAQREAGYFVVNRSSTPIFQIQLAIPGTDEWGPDLLAGVVVYANGRFKIAPPSGACVVDVRVAYKDSRFEIERARNVCGTGEIAFDGSRRERQQEQNDRALRERQKAAQEQLLAQQEQQRQRQAQERASSAARPGSTPPKAPTAGSSPLEPLAVGTPSPSPPGGLAIRSLAVQATTTLPNFPWPPPEPSARAELSSNIFSTSGKPAPSLAAIGTQLVRVLDQAKYPEYSYYRAPGGFALVARLERMSNDGTPLPEQFRFLQPGSVEPFSLSVYVKQLFFAPEGFYRQIVFVISDQPFTATGQKIDAKDAQQLLRGGMNRLPREFDAMPFTTEHRASALIYEFRKGSRDGDVATLTPGRLAARTHLERAGLYQALTKTSQ